MGADGSRFSILGANKRVGGKTDMRDDTPVPLSIDELIFYLPHLVFKVPHQQCLGEEAEESEDEKPMRRELESRKGRELRS